MALPRRSLLRWASTTATALAGCATRRPQSANATDEPTNTTTEREPTQETTQEQTEVDLSGEPFAQFRVDPTPTRIPLDHRATVVSEATESSPAQIRVTIANPSDESHVVRTANYGLPFPDPVSDTTDDGTNLVLGDDYGDPEDGCWKGWGETEPMSETAELATDERLQEEYYVLDYAENETCWPSGEYRFGVGYTLNPDDEAIEYTWGFDLIV